jgi:hypothetical protein
MPESKAKTSEINIEVDKTFTKTSIKVEKRTSIVFYILYPDQLASSTFYYQAGNTMYCRTLLL